MTNHPLAIEKIVSEPFDENSYVVWRVGRSECIVFDPGFDVPAIEELLASKQLTPAAIVNTHGHADHIAGNGPLKQLWPDCPLVIGRGDASKLTDPVGNLSRPFGMDLLSPPADVLLDDGCQYSAAELTFDVHEIAGHSSGHVIFVWHRAASDPPDATGIVFGGDILFAGSIGRYDFPDGSFAKLAAGIHRYLYTLPENTQVFPGHGPTTTIGRERRTNPYVSDRIGHGG